MENLMLFFSSISESWSTLSADQFFSMYSFTELTTPAALRFESPATDRFGQVLDMLRFFGATFFVALLAWFVTKKMAGSRGVGRETCNLSVVESLNVGGQAVVRLVRVGDKYLLIGVTKENVTLLAEIDEDQISEQQAIEMTGLNTPFSKVFSRFIQPKDEPRDEEKNE
jgi:flagellar protein FliO/FliZ